MIAIPNMDKPKSCVECHWYYELYDEHCTLGEFLLREYTTDASEEPYILDTQRHSDCPIIDIVTCEECKHWYNDADCGMACEFTNMGQPINGFCNWGERRNE